jgi:hypothetical protein
MKSFKDRHVWMGDADDDPPKFMSYPTPSALKESK